MPHDAMILVEVSINEKIESMVHVQDIVSAINKIPIIERYNAIAKILTGLKDDDLQELSTEHYQLIKDFVQKQHKRFK